MINKVTETVFYVGANDHDVDLFEGQYVVPDGMAYNSYVIKDEKTAVIDTIDKSKTAEWLANVEEALGGAFSKNTLSSGCTSALTSGEKAISFIFSAPMIIAEVLLIVETSLYIN